MAESDWEIVPDQNAQPSSQQSSDWELVPEQSSQPSEGLGTSLYMALPRIGSDVYKNVGQAVLNIPNYYDAAKVAIPQAGKIIAQQPTRALSQAGAGLAELGQNVFNTPHDLINYLSTRLNLFPKDINRMVQMGRLPADTEALINQQFGAPQNIGESFIRGVPRNALNIGGVVGLANFANPLRYRPSSIMKDVVSTRNALKTRYGRTYNNIFNDAETAGVGGGLRNIVPQIDYATATMNEPGHAVSSIQEFITNPTTRTAHEAKRDMLKMQRKLIAKNERDSLTGGELDKLNELNRAIPLIEDSMFRDQFGNIHNRLADRYRKTQVGYRTEVLPYTQNKAINAFIKGEKLPNEAVNSLSRGKFAAMRGSEHPEIGRRKALGKVFPYGVAGLAGYGGKALIDYLYREPENNQ